MAKVKIVEITPVPPPKEVVLTLSIEEAEVLRLITGSILGGGFGRAVANDIYEVLDDAGINNANIKVNSCLDFDS